ncbi:hypothetical protein GFH48_26720 [Streptomyces fagopyri]|uniref:Uncharacterized protein n=1 Tax=Streptomyces fagopyri TaxID=2662397 RepID=A0A5Q0LGT0_9ACTN|nr:hypothetical protein [Streptomyces fagopyri]QFZ76382.1 hypothetical protein GFH48_26720 [Streptomyces fagopyri]
MSSPSTEAAHAFISATRGSKSLDSALPELKHLYSQFAAQALDYVRKIAHPQRLGSLSLVPTYSCNPKAENFTLDGTTYVIYDQFGGQVFNKLNRFIFEPFEQRYIETYLHKLWACLNLANGAPRRALDHALCYSRAGKYRWLPLIEERETRALFTAAQEAFVIAHEVAHFFYRHRTIGNSAVKRNFISLLKLGDEWERSKSQHVDDSEVIKDALASWVDGFRRRAGRDPDANEISIYVERMKSRSSRRWDPRIDLIDVVLQDAELLEECICDALGADIAARVLQREMGYVGALLAVSLGLQNLRFLQYADKLTRFMSGRLESLDHHHTDVRRWLSFRHISLGLLMRYLDDAVDLSVEVPMSMDEYLGCGDILNDYVGRFAKFNSRHYSAISEGGAEPFLATSAFEIDGLHLNADYEPLVSISNKQCAMLTRQLCGWR